MIRQWRARLKSNQGASTVFIALSVFILTGCTVVFSDTGLLLANRVSLSSLVDETVRVGLQELSAGSHAAITAARTYARLHGKEGDAFDVRVVDGTSLTVSATRTVPLFFAKLFGISTSNIVASASAKISQTGVIAENNGTWGSADRGNFRNDKPGIL